MNGWEAASGSTNESHPITTKQKGHVMKIDMPILVTVECAECHSKFETHYSKYGAIEPCINCDAAPADLVKVG